MRSIPKNQRDSIVSLLKQGETVRSVAEVVGVSTTTVSRIGMEAEPDRMLHKGDRPQSLSSADKRFCIRMVTIGKVDNAVKIKKLLEKDHGIVCSSDTIKRALRSIGLGAIEKPKKPLLTKRNV